MYNHVNINNKKQTVKRNQKNRRAVTFPYAKSVSDTGICKTVKHLFINLGEQQPILEDKYNIEL